MNEIEIGPGERSGSSELENTVEIGGKRFNVVEEGIIERYELNGYFTRFLSLLYPTLLLPVLCMFVIDSLVFKLCVLFLIILPLFLIYLTPLFKQRIVFNRNDRNVSSYDCFSRMKFREPYHKLQTRTLCYGGRGLSRKKEYRLGRKNKKGKKPAYIEFIYTNKKEFQIAMNEFMNK